MDLSIITISFNTRELIKQCLASLASLKDVQIGCDFEVIVVDNGSSDGSVEMIKSEFPQVKLIETGQNLGFSKGNNRGVQNLDPSVSYVLFLNSDTVVPNGTLSEMLKFMRENPNVGVATCKVLLWEGAPWSRMTRMIGENIDLDCHRGFPTPWVSLTRLLGLGQLFPFSRFLNGYYLGCKELNHVRRGNLTHDIDAAVGAFMLVRREVGHKIGWWDEDYFLNGEDIDFCYQVKALRQGSGQAGYRVVYHPAVSITHYRGASKGTRKESQGVSNVNMESRRRVANASVDAMQLFYDKNLRNKYPWVVGKLVDVSLWGLRRVRLLKLKF